MGAHRSTGSANFSHFRCRNRAFLKALAGSFGFRGVIHLWSGNPAETLKIFEAAENVRFFNRAWESSSVGHSSSCWFVTRVGHASSMVSI